MNTIDFVKNQLRLLFPDIDLTVGSPVDRDLIQPLRSRLGDELLGISAGEIIRARLASEYPEMSGIQTEDLLVKPADLILEPLRQIIGRIDVQTSTNDLTSLTDDELDAVVSTLFIYRVIGTYAEYQMRLYVRNPRPIVLGPDNICKTGAGLSYYPSRVYTFHVPDIMANREGGLYFVEFNAVSAGRGERYNVGAGEINSITGVTDAVRVRNIRKISSGTDTETNEELLARVSTMLGERSLVSDSGIVAKINSLSNGSLRRVSVVGRGEEDMLRDVLTADITVTDDLFGEPYNGGMDGTCPDWTGGLRTYYGYSDTLNVTTDAFTDTIIGDEVIVMDSLGNFGFGTVKTVHSAQSLEVTGLDEILSSSGTTVAVPVPATAANLPMQDTFRDTTGVIFESVATEGDVILVPGQALTVSGTEGEYLYVGPQRILVLQACDSVANQAQTLASPAQVQIGVPVDVNVQVGDFITLERAAFTELSMHEIQNISVDTLIIDPPLGWTTVGADTKWTIHRNSNDGWDPLTGINSSYFGVAFSWPGGPMGYTLVDVEGTPLPSGSPVAWSIHHASTDSIVALLSINDMPGGKLVTDEAPYVPGQVHVGGCADAYVYDNGKTGTSLTLNGLIGVETVIDAYNLSCTSGSDEWVGTVNFEAAGVRAGDVLFIPNTYGSVTGSYIIREATTSSLFTKEDAPDTASNMDYQIVRSVKTPMDRPRNLIDYGSDLTLSPFTSVVTFGHNIIQQGAVSGNTIRVTPENTAPFEMTIISLDPGGLQATVQAPPAFSGSSIGYEIWDSYGAPGFVQRPIIEVTDVSVGDYTIPYARPVLSLLVSLSRYTQKAPTEIKRTPYVSIVAGSTTMYFLHNHPDFYEVAEGDFILVNSVQFQVETVSETTWSVTVTEAAENSIGFSPATIAPPQIGTMRVYFKDPTEGWIDPDTLFTLRSNSLYTMSPDDRAYRLVSTGDTAEVATASPDTFVTNDDNFNLYHWDVGDYLVIESKSIVSGPIAGPSVNVNGKYLSLSVDGEIRAISFTGTDPINLTGYSGAGGVVQQINAANLGITATVEESGGSWYVVLASSRLVTLQGNVSAAIELSFTAASYSNVSVNADTYIISGSAGAGLTGQVTVTDEDGGAVTWTANETRLTYRVYRKRAKEIDLVEMRDTNNEMGMYYTDVPVSANFIGVSRPVNVYNEFDCEGETAYGYWFSTAKESLVGSIYEEVDLYLSATCPDIGGSGGLDNQITVAGEDVVIKYDSSSAIIATQNSMLRESNRNVLASIFVMHKFPAYVRLFLSYTGGSSVSVIRSDLDKLLATSDFLGRLTAYEIGKMLVMRHTIDGVEPVTMLKLAWDRDRSWYATLSQDRLVFGSLEFPKLDWENSSVNGGAVLTGELAGLGSSAS